MSKASGALMQRVLMVPPDHFTVEYNINPWMGGTVDKNLAMKQWTALRDAIAKQGVEVLTLEQQPDLPDQVFVCNSGLVCGKNVFLSRFRHKERTGEEKHYLKWFQDNGFTIFGQDSQGIFEGGGDVVFSDPHTLWAGYGERSSLEAIDRLKAIGNFETVICETVDPRFYHLDTCFCPVDETTAIYYPPAFSAKTQEEIITRMPNSIAVSEQEAKAFICNAITVRNAVISPVGVEDKTRAALAARGFEVIEVNMSEFMKSGGACQCLVLRL